MTEEMGGAGAVLEVELELAKESVPSARAVLLVEGESDRRSLEVLASRSGRHLRSESIVIVATAGATNIGHFLALLPTRIGLCGLYDQAEEPILRRALEAAPTPSRLAGQSLESIGFFMCRRDLEEELIRAVGVDGVLEVIDREDDLRSWQRFCAQPAQRGRPIEALLHRFLGTRSGRKIEYAGLLAEMIDLWDDESPLIRVLAHSRRSRRADA